MRKSKKILLGTVICTTFLAVGCGAESKIEKGINYLNEGKYEEASGLFEEVLKKNPENEKVKDLEEMLENYKVAKEEYDKNNLDEAKKILDKIPESYMEFNIKTSIDELKKCVNDKIKIIEDNDSSLNKIQELLKSNKLVEGKKSIEIIKEDSFTKEQKELLHKLKSELGKREEEARKEEENKRKLEEQKRKEGEKKKKEEERKKQESLENKNNVASQKPAAVSKTYVSKKLGIQMTIPASWNGYYKIYENEDGITFRYVNKSNPKIEGVICRIEKEIEYNMLDGAIPKVINGQKYLIGTNTDIGTNAYDIDRNIYNHFKGLQSQIQALANSLKSSN